MPQGRDRRAVLRWGLMGLVGLRVGPAKAGVAETLRPEVRSIRVVEAGGFRRVGSPIRAILEGFGPAPIAALTIDGRPVEAQFSDIARPGGRVDVAVDFEADLAPGESRRFEARRGLAGGSGPVRGGGLRVERAGDRILVVQPSGMAFEFGPGWPAGESSWSAGSAGVGFLAPGGMSIAIVRRDGVPLAPAGAGSLRVVGHGQITASLTAETGPLAGGRIAAQLDILVPRSRPWIEATLVLDDPDEEVESFGVRFRLASPGRANVEPSAVEVIGPDRRVALASLVGDAGAAGVKVEVGEGGRMLAIGRDRRAATAGRPGRLAFRILCEPRPARPGSSSGLGSLAEPPRVVVDPDRPSSG